MRWESLPYLRNRPRRRSPEASDRFWNTQVASQALFDYQESSTVEDFLIGPPHPEGNG